MIRSKKTGEIRHHTSIVRGNKKRVNVPLFPGEPGQIEWCITNEMQPLRRESIWKSLN